MPKQLSNLIVAFFETANLVSANCLQRIRVFCFGVRFLSVVEKDNHMHFSEYNLNTRSSLTEWLEKMPVESLERLRRINESTGSAKHVVLTIAFSLYDSNIRSIGRMITGLLIKRMQAEQVGSAIQVERINEYMLQMHESIDEVTGVHRALNGPRHACNRASRPQCREGGVL